MSSNTEAIWEKAKQYRDVSGNGHRYPRFLFVPINELRQDVVDDLDETDANILCLPCMADKTEVFDVVYNKTARRMGGQLDVTDNGLYLIFQLKETDKHEQVIA